MYNMCIVYLYIHTYVYIYLKYYIYIIYILERGGGGLIQNFFLDGSSMKKCDHTCDQALIKNIWGSV